MDFRKLIKAAVTSVARNTTAPPAEHEASKGGIQTGHNVSVGNAPIRPPIGIPNSPVVEELKPGIRSPESQIKAERLDSNTTPWSTKERYLERKRPFEDANGINLQVDLSRPVGMNLHLLVEPEAHKVIQMLELTPGIVEAALNVTESPHKAFNFLLADNVNLSSDQLVSLIDVYGHKSQRLLNKGTPQQGHTIDASAEKDSLVKQAVEDLKKAWERAYKSGGHDLDQVMDNILSGFDKGFVDAEKLKEAMERTFGYTIKWEGILDPATNPDSNLQKRLILNLLTANLHIIAYFDETRSPTGSRLQKSGLRVFREAFAKSIEVDLGADEVTKTAGQAGKYSGETPLKSNKMSLGSEMSIAGIVHEFGHQLIRFAHAEPEAYGNPNTFRQFVFKASKGQRQMDQRAMKVRVGLGDTEKADDDAEIFADMFMTAVLDQQQIAAQPKDVTVDQYYNQIVGWQDQDREFYSLMMRDYLVELLRKYLKT